MSGDLSSRRLKLGKAHVFRSDLRIRKHVALKTDNCLPLALKAVLVTVYVYAVKKHASIRPFRRLVTAPISPGVGPEAVDVVAQELFPKRNETTSNTTSFLVTTSKALVPSSVALVPTSCCYYSLLFRFFVCLLLSSFWGEAERAKACEPSSPS